MNKIRTVKRSLVMLLLIALCSTGAYADAVFSIRIEDLTNQSGIVMQTGAPGMLYLINQSLGAGSNITLPGLTLAFSQFQDPSGFYESKLHFDGTVQALGPGTLRITVESTGFPGSNLPATLEGSYTANKLPPYATMTFGAWTNVYDASVAGSVPGGAVPDLGAAGTYALPGSLPAINDGSPNIYTSPQTTAAWVGGTATVGPYDSAMNIGGAGATSSANFVDGNGYSLWLQSTVSFMSPGIMSFSGDSEVMLATGNVTPETSSTLPEPTSLLLLGSCFVGAGILRKKFVPAA